MVLLGLWWATRGDGAATSGGGGTTRSVAVTAGASASTTPDSGLATIAESALPDAAQAMLPLIHAGGPFRYSEDGQTFGNREGLLPSRARTYYREYTVKKGSSGDRGPLRIIGGQRGDLYWTSDHYAHFAQIQEGR